MSVAIRNQPEPPWNGAEHRCLLVAVGLYAGLLVALGAALHPVDVNGGEADRYVDQAAALLQGVVFGDRFHPFLYAELVAACTWLCGDPFAAGRLVSSLAAGVFAYASYRLIRLLAGVRGAAVGTSMIMANAAVTLHGVQAASDMTASAFFVVGLWQLFAAGGRTRGSVLAGIAFGLAVATRLNLGLLLPLTAAVVIGIGSGPVASRIRALLGFVVGAIIGYLPHGVLSVIAFGTPMTGDSWRNLSLKLSGFDEAALNAPPYADVFELLRVDGGRLLAMAGDDLVTIWTEAFGCLLAGGHCVDWLAATLSATLVVAMIVQLVGKRDRLTVAATLIVLAATATIAVTFYPQIRLLMPFLPIAWAAIAVAIAGLPGWLRRLITVLLAAAVATSLHPSWRQFIDSHPLAEIAAARDLASRHGPLVTIASCYSPMARHVAARTVYVPHPPVSQRNAEAFFRQVSVAAAELAADYLVVGRRTLFGIDVADLRAHLPPLATVDHADDALLVLRLARTEPAWLAEASVVAAQPGQLSLRIVVTPGVDVLTAGFTAFPPNHPPTLVPLSRTAADRFEALMPIPRESPSTWTFVPGCLLPSGAAHRGAPIVVTW